MQISDLAIQSAVRRRDRRPCFFKRDAVHAKAVSFVNDCCGTQGAATRIRLGSFPCSNAFRRAQRDDPDEGTSCQIVTSILLNRCVQIARGWLGQDCQFCGGSGGPGLLCPGCAAELPALPAHCPRCATPIPGGALCGDCLIRPPAFDHTTALWRYEFPCDRMIQALKYHARLALAGFFAGMLASKPLARVDLIVPMPLHPTRLAGRGFNQAVEIARPLSRLIAIPAELHGARRVKNTVPQTDLPYEERAKNVRGTFACGLDLSGLAIAIVDDVMTTGATLNELARTLKLAGAARVENWVIARTMPY
jgi:ComF family protein